MTPLLSLFLTIFLTACGGNGESDITPSTTDISDTLKPIITLKGEQKIDIQQHAVFHDPGASATDNIDKKLTILITPQNINTDTLGKQTITYTATDKAGNRATTSRTITIVDAQNITPQRGLHINEVLVGNSYSHINPLTKQYDGWIELFNNSNSAINLQGYSLHDETHHWNFPTTTIQAQAYLLVYLGKGQGLYTGFKLDMDGGTLTFQEGENTIDTFIYSKQIGDISFTKHNDLLYYMTPSPATTNTQALSRLKPSKNPDFSLESGFYATPQTLTLSPKSSGEIYYTTDGSIPTTHSTHYTHPIHIIKNTVIRARTLSPFKQLSPIKNRSYFINENVTLPVVSIGINTAFLNDDKIGIYALGTNDQGTPNIKDYEHPNYMHNWTRAASIEYIKNNISQFSENIGISIHGSGSRTFDQKSLTVRAKAKYGTKSIKYQLFSDKNIKKFKTFLLRNSGGDHDQTMMHDALAQAIVKDDLDLDYQAYQPTVMFINGAYWGIYNLRETTNDDYLKANHHIDSKKVDILYNNNHVLKGNVNAYLPVQQLIENNNANVSFNEVTKVLDIPAYIDYLIAEIYIGNQDWPGRNRKYWREQKDGAKWRYFFYDLDLSMLNASHDTLSFALGEVPGSVLGEGNDYNLPFATKMIKRLIENSQFKNAFASKYVTCLNTIFMPSRVESVIDKIQSTIAPEIQRHFRRWTPIDNQSWQSRVQTQYYNYFQDRHNAARTALYSRLNLGNDHTLHIDKSNHGDIFIDGIKLDNAFDGDYFSGATISLSPQAKTGYQFDKWLVNNTSNSNNTLEIILTQDTQVQAQFIPFDGEKISINEINFKSSKDFDTGDWIELYNPNQKDIDLSGWQLIDDSQARYTFAAHTRITAHDYLVIAEDKNKFSKHLPHTPVLGNLPFGISSKGDSLSLYNAQHTLVNHITFTTAWTKDAKAGDTLSLNNPNSDNTQKDNWSFATSHGTPARGN